MRWAGHVAIYGNGTLQYLELMYFPVWILPKISKFTAQYEGSLFRRLCLQATD
jgi:hypothetical protein